MERTTRASSDLKIVPFVLFHLLALAGVAWYGWSWTGLALAVGSYYFRMFWVTGGYHRYFSHRTFRTSRAFQAVLAFMAQTSLQKGAIWWAGHHRRHHKYSDQPGDVHSALLRGLWWSHVGWILSPEHDEPEWHRVPDLVKYSELMWLNRWHILPGVLYAVAMFLAGGTHALLWGFFVSTVMLWHGSFLINSLAHKIGRRRYPTTDQSRNSMILALLTLGEGHHNNHHHYQGSARQGFFWWEIDVTYYVLRLLALVRLVWDIHEPPRRVVLGAVSEKVEEPAPLGLVPAAEKA